MANMDACCKRLCKELFQQPWGDRRILHLVCVVVPFDLITWWSAFGKRFYLKSWLSMGAIFPFTVWKMGSWGRKWSSVVQHTPGCTVCDWHASVAGFAHQQCKRKKKVWVTWGVLEKQWGIRDKFNYNSILFTFEKRTINVSVFIWFTMALLEELVTGGRLGGLICLSHSPVWLLQLSLPAVCGWRCSSSSIILTCPLPCLPPRWSWTKPLKLCAAPGKGFPW